MMPQSKLQQFIANIYQIVLTIFYYVLIFPVSWRSQNISDPLMIDQRLTPHKKGQLWLKRTTNDVNLDDARRQF